MLILTRRIGETIIIGGNIEITLLDIKQGQIRLGVEAPKDIPVHRGELLLKKNLGGRTFDK
ncbi:carbon storage regulator CsrA (plasmid) [Flagellatimonas centrodinii]|uniref:carbon storage regulator CsrA n=1 Tax=Flagellatimonas centrodinii TaxID=2806210 RepID=UPI001FFB926C|nr:carbon storage regulator CsrA [Flagellatimonas centrodinii]ULQ48390.1 carbon storage regulator CsrA [Flagellatimonas centrodinii]